MATYQCDLKGERGKVFKPFVVVKPVDGKKAIVLCLDSGDGKELKLGHDQIEALGLKPGAHKFQLGPLSAIKGVGAEVTEESIVEVEDSRMAAQATLELKQEIATSKQHIVTLAYLTENGLKATLNPLTPIRKVVKTGASGLSNAGVTELYSSDVVFSCPPNNLPIQVPILTWMESVPVVRVSYYINKQKAPEADGGMVIDTGSPITLVPSEYYPSTGIADKICIQAGSDTVEFLNARVTEFDEFILGMDLFSQSYVMRFGAPGTQTIGLMSNSNRVSKIG